MDFIEFGPDEKGRSIRFVSNFQLKPGSVMLHIKFKYIQQVNNLK